LFPKPTCPLKVHSMDSCKKKRISCEKRPILNIHEQRGTYQCKRSISTVNGLPETYGSVSGQVDILRTCNSEEEENMSLCWRSTNDPVQLSFLMNRTVSDELHKKEEGDQKQQIQTPHTTHSVHT
ncbi:MAG: hypothetical protein ACO35C_05390, partial [Pontimonas sp.]